MPARKHIPQRTCVVCRRVSAKRELWRLVWTPERGLVVDLTGKLAGRGAYVCRSRRCWEQVVHQPARWVGRSLKTTLSESDATVLRQWMQEHNDLLTDAAAPLAKGEAASASN